MAILPPGRAQALGTELIDNAELIGQRSIGHLSQSVAHPLHVAHKRRIHHIVAALGLARGQIVLLADSYFLAGGDELNLLLARDRVDAAAGQNDQPS